MKTHEAILNNQKLSEGPLKLVHLRILEGANYFSGGPVVHLKVDLGDYDEVFTNDIPDFFEQLKIIVPSLIEHHCSEGVRGGFFTRVLNGTLLGHVIEHVAIELQSLAGMDVSYGKTRSSLQQGVYNIVFRFLDEYAGLYAAKASFSLVNSILTKQSVDLSRTIHELELIRESRLLGPSTQAIVYEIEKREIPWLRLDEYNLIQIGTGSFQQRIRATLTPSTSLIAIETSQDRVLMAKMLADAGLPVPLFFVSDDVHELSDFILKTPGKFFLRPRHRSIPFSKTLCVENEDELIKATALIQSDREELMLQQSAHGKIFRLLVINGQCVGVAQIELPCIIGDGMQTIAQLMEKVNQEPDRRMGDKGKLSFVLADPETDLLLKLKNFDYQEILPEGYILTLKISPNPNNGSRSENVTDIVHVDYKNLAVRSVRVTGLDVAVVNMISEDLTVPFCKTNAVITDIQAAPNFRMYVSPSNGTPQAVEVPFVDFLLKEMRYTHAPLISVTGSYGKTSCSDIIFRCLKGMGLRAGKATSDGLFLNEIQVRESGVDGNDPIRIMLRDPDTDVCIAETPVENILRFGLAYDKADYGIVLNISDNHLPENDISRMDDLAYAKSVVAESVREDGYAVLNADEPLILEMMSRIDSKTAFFSVNQSKSISDLIEDGHPVLIYQNGLCVFWVGKKKLSEFDLSEKSSILNPSKQVPYESVMAAILVLLLHGADHATILKALS